MAQWRALWMAVSWADRKVDLLVHKMVALKAVMMVGLMASKY